MALLARIFRLIGGILLFALFLSLVMGIMFWINLFEWLKGVL